MTVTIYITHLWVLSFLSFKLPIEKEKQNKRTNHCPFIHEILKHLNFHHIITTTTTAIMKVNHRITKGVAYLLDLTFGHVTHIPQARDIRFMCISLKTQLY